MVSLRSKSRSRQGIRRSGRPTTALEADLPVEWLSELALLESYRKEIHRPIYHVHKWWATRLGSVFRAIMLGANLPPSADLFTNFYRGQNFDDCVVLDPFLGSGTTVGEALKLGCRAVGADINPISSFQVETMLRACGDCTVERLRAAYHRLEREVSPKIVQYYRSTYQGETADLLYAFWVKTLPCPDCGEITRLFDRWLFASHAYPRRHPESRALCPKCGALVEVDHASRQAQCRACGHRFDPRAGPAGRHSFECEACGRRHRTLDVVRAARTPPEHQLYALMLLLGDGRRVYKPPDAADLTLYRDAARALRRRRLPLPTARIPAGHNTDQARAYNYRTWRQMFNDRQLLCLGELLRGILRGQDATAREAMLLLFSGVLEFNNLFCTFKGEGTGAVRHLFAHHVLRPPRTPLEANPWGTPRSSGAFSTLYERRLLAAARYCAEPTEIALQRRRGGRTSAKVAGCSRPLRPRLAARFSTVARGDADALILTGDSSRLPLPDRCANLVITDPPYFDNVHYSELADFFHAWLQAPLAQHRPAFRARTTRHPREVQATSATEFGTRLGDVLRECVRVLKPGGLVAFTFHHARLEAWFELDRALDQAGLAVTAAHPVIAEMSGAAPLRRAREPIQLDLIVVCRPRRRAPAPKRARISDATLQQRTQRAVDRLGALRPKLTRGDLRVILMGELLKIGTGTLARSSPSDLTPRLERIIPRLRT